MTVYVDKYPEWLNVSPKWTDGGHLFGTDLEELHTFAQSIGLNRNWYQNRHGGFPHYDLTKNKRKQAIRRGATKIEPGIIPDGVIRHDPNS